MRNDFVALKMTVLGVARRASDCGGGGIGGRDGRVSRIGVGPLGVTLCMGTPQKVKREEGGRRGRA